MIDRQLPYATYLRCPVCQGTVRAINGRYGWFWGCQQYPRCDGKLNLDAAEWQIRSALGVDWDYYDEDIDGLNQPF
jgi:ssDNA-binding Zn-finger/Zn-ribbon topoisomerase 1